MTQGKLGFGFMRLPTLDGNPENIDFEQLDQMVDEFLGNGFTYLIQRKLDAIIDGHALFLQLCGN